MERERIYIADTPLKAPDGPPTGKVVERAGRPYYRIEQVDRMPPFLMSVVSSSDHWLYPASNGGLSAGRIDPDHALFPYETDDRIFDGARTTGSRTLLRIGGRGRVSLWEPLSDGEPRLYETTRSLYKSLHGDEVLFEEVNHDLRVVFRYSWRTSGRFGFLRSAELVNEGSGPLQIDLLDGLQNLLPSGLLRRFQNEFSTLADAYKESELDPGTNLALFRLSSIPTDKAEPSEALTATTVWSHGLPDPRVLLSTLQLAAFRAGEPVEREEFVRGRRGAYLLSSRVELAAGERLSWQIVADVAQDAAGVRDLLAHLRHEADPIEAVVDDVERGSKLLERMVASADGLQCSGDLLAGWRHYSNTVFNLMRGGLPEGGYRIPVGELTAFISRASRRVAEREGSFLTELPDRVEYTELLTLVRGRNDLALERLVREFLPFSFSRRHGDPSRPWNDFSIHLSDAAGERILDYQGNWRDIFQNWEALALSFPEFVEGMIFKFLDSSTADGYNPYRLTLDGFDWEVPNPHDPWAHIGYWGDHQVVYLLRLLELSRRYHPDRLEGYLDRQLFTYANVPYRIRPYEEMLAEPRETIDFSWELHEEIMGRVSEEGTEAKLVRGGDGEPWRASLIEKLLVAILTKLSNLVPGAGIWMNTQRPEWNDANNALVGYGASVVTVAYLRRLLILCDELLTTAGERSFPIAVEVADLLSGVQDVLDRHAPTLDRGFDDEARKAFLDSLGRVGEAYRARVYDGGFSGRLRGVDEGEVRHLFDRALRYLDHTLEVNMREDGLAHSYNLIEIGEHRIGVRRLQEMLEGQVAMISSGHLSVERAVDLLDALTESRLFRPDQASFLLYPDRRLPRFLEKNNLSAVDIAESRLLTEMVQAGDRRLIVRDREGGLHFNASFRNAGELGAALTELEADPDYGPYITAERSELLALYERVFDHRSFTGRSGTFYKYEGLGSIYWHMVSKLLLAVQELMAAAEERGELDDRTRLRSHYRSIHDGIGVHKPPSLYGAVPTDPYSHTPVFAGAQQPGMTGQVKEDLLSRFGELGVMVIDGRLAFRPGFLREGDFLSVPRPFTYYTIGGEAKTVQVDEQTLAFTLCQVLVVVHRAGGPRIEVTDSDGRANTHPALELDQETSGRIFDRSGRVERIDVFLS